MNKHFRSLFYLSSVRKTRTIACRNSNTMIDYSSKPVQYITLVLLAFTWGSSFILMKRGLMAFTPEEIAAYRIVCTTAVLLPFAGKHFKVFRGKDAGALLLTGLFGALFPYFLFVKAQTQIDSSLTGILNSTTPIFALLLSVFLFKQKVKPLSGLGVLAGFIGAAGLVAYGSENTFDWNAFNIYTLLPVLGAACYGANVNIVKLYLNDMKPMAISALSFLSVMPFALVYLIFYTDFFSKMAIADSETLSSFGYITILAVAGTAIAVLIFNNLIKHTGALTASSVTYMIPLFAIFWGVLDGESFSFIRFLFALLILTGVGLINTNHTLAEFRAKVLNKMP